MCFSWFLCCVLFQFYVTEFIPMKIIIFTFCFTFLNKRTFKNKTHIMILVQSLRRNLKQIKNGKKNGTGYSFQRNKSCFALSAGNTKKKWKRCLASLRPFYQGVTTSRHLVCQTMIKVRCRCKLLTKANISNAQNVGRIITQLCNEPVV